MGTLTGRRPYVVPAVLVALAAAVLLSLMVGRQALSPEAVWHALFGAAAGPDTDVVRGLRLQRTVVALVVGMALGGAGALMQALTRNPLADPGLLGVNAGASALVFGNATLGIGPNMVTLLSAVTTAAGLVLLVVAPVSLATGVGVAALFVLGFALDSADGQVARLTGSSSPAGEWLDHVVDAGKMVAVHAAVLIALWRDEVAPGWLALSLGYQFVSVVFFAALTLFLLSDAAGNITGSYHLVDGGFTAQ